MDALKPAERGGFRTQAAMVRRRARRVLEGNRMTLILSVIVLLVTAMGVYLGAVALYMAGSLYFGDVLWLELATYALMGVLGLFLVLPLGVGVWRMACLMTLRGQETPSPLHLPVTKERPTLDQVFYPLSSFRDYGRALAVGLEGLGWLSLYAGIPTAGFCVLRRIFATMSIRGVHMTLCNLLTLASLVLCVAVGLVLFFLSGRRAGFGYFVFIHDGLSLKEINRYFRGFRRSFARPFVLRASLVGWVALSVVGVLIPFVVHTIPYALCCSAVYAAGLERK